MGAYVELRPTDKNHDLYRGKALTLKGALEATCGDSAKTGEVCFDFAEKKPIYLAYPSKTLEALRKGTLSSCECNPANQASPLGRMTLSLPFHARHQNVVPRKDLVFYIMFNNDLTLMYRDVVPVGDAFADSMAELVAINDLPSELGLLVADLNNDGDLDIITIAQDGSMKIFLFDPDAERPSSENSAGRPLPITRQEIK